MSARWNSGRLESISATHSPRPTPSAASPPASASTRSANCAQVSETPSSRVLNATRSGCSAAVRRSASVTVDASTARSAGATRGARLHRCLLGVRPRYLFRTLPCTPRNRPSRHRNISVRSELVTARVRCEVTDDRGDLVRRAARERLRPSPDQPHRRPGGGGRRALAGGGCDHASAASVAYAASVARAVASRRPRCRRCRARSSGSTSTVRSPAGSPAFRRRCRRWSAPASSRSARRSTGPPPSRRRPVPTTSPRPT